MRIQNIVMALLVFVACMTALGNIATDLENEWGVDDTQLNNGSGNVTEILDLFNFYEFSNDQQLIVNASQYAPGGIDAETPDGVATTSSSLIMAYKFGQIVMSLPKVIILKMGGFFDIDPIWLTTLIIWIVLIVVFILASAIFFNKL